MKCPRCNAWTEVLRTREGIKRRRQCANGHRFNTIEVQHASTKDDDGRALCGQPDVCGQGGNAIVREMR